MQNKELLVHIEGCRRSSEKSRSWIFNRYYRLMFGVCLRYVSDKDAVQDVVQEGFLKIFSNIDGYTSKGSFEGWMRRIMVNTAIDAIRSRKATGLVLGLEESFEEIPDEAVFPIEEEEDVETFTCLSPKPQSININLSPSSISNDRIAQGQRLFESAGFVLDHSFLGTTPNIAPPSNLKLPL